jgi:hypothetical protein
MITGNLGNMKIIQGEGHGSERTYSTNPEALACCGHVASTHVDGWCRLCTCCCTPVLNPVTCPDPVAEDVRKYK